MVHSDPYSPQTKHYECANCGYREFSDDRLTECPRCGSELRNIGVVRE